MARSTLVWYVGRGCDGFCVHSHTHTPRSLLPSFWPWVITWSVTADRDAHNSPSHVLLQTPQKQEGPSWRTLDTAELHRVYFSTQPEAQSLYFLTALINRATWGSL